MSSLQAIDQRLHECNWLNNKYVVARFPVSDGIRTMEALNSRGKFSDQHIAKTWDTAKAAIRNSLKHAGSVAIHYEEYIPLMQMRTEILAKKVELFGRKELDDFLNEKRLETESAIAFVLKATDGDWRIVVEKFGRVTLHDSKDLDKRGAIERAMTIFPDCEVRFREPFQTHTPS